MQKQNLESTFKATKMNQFPKFFLDDIEVTLMIKKQVDAFKNEVL